MCILKYMKNQTSLQQLSVEVIILFICINKNAKEMQVSSRFQKITSGQLSTCS